MHRGHSSSRDHRGFALLTRKEAEVCCSIGGQQGFDSEGWVKKEFIKDRVTLPLSTPKRVKD
jgi:hypothetical protein